MKTKNFEVEVSPCAIEVRLRHPEIVLSRVQRSGYPFRVELRTAIKVARKMLYREQKLAMERMSRDAKLLYLSVAATPKLPCF